LARVGDALGYDMTRPALLLQAFIRHGG